MDFFFRVTVKGEHGASASPELIAAALQRQFERHMVDRVFFIGDGEYCVEKIVETVSPLPSVLR